MHVHMLTIFKAQSGTVLFFSGFKSWRKYAYMQKVPHFLSLAPFLFSRLLTHKHILTHYLTQSHTHTHYGAPAHELKSRAGPEGRNYSGRSAAWQRTGREGRQMEREKERNMERKKEKREEMIEKTRERRIMRPLIKYQLIWHGDDQKTAGAILCVSPAVFPRCCLFESTLLTLSVHVSPV